MKTFYILYLILVGFSGCALASVDRIDDFFPAASLDADPKFNQYRVKWYGQNLLALHESSLLRLSIENNKIQIYRFTWLRSFDDPMAFRLEILADGTGKLTIKKAKLKELSDRYELGGILRDDSVIITSKQVGSFLNLLNKSNFWNLSSYVSDKGLDGSQWIYEGIRSGQYHITDRWTPKDAAYKDLGLYLIKIAKETNEQLY